MSNFKKDLAVIGLGYVGLPLVVESSNCGLKVVGYDNNPERDRPEMFGTLTLCRIC